jgi:hypothetical protein
MDLCLQSELQHPIHFQVEDFARLYRRLDQQFGFDDLTSHQRETVLRSVAAGLRQFPVDPDAIEWAGVFEQLAQIEIEDAPITASGPRGAHRGILQILVKQPAPSRTPEQRKRCLAVGALAFLAISFDLVRIPGRFALQLGQLFRSTRPDWVAFCGVNFTDESSLSAWKPEEDALAVVSELRDGLLKLLGTPVPSLEGFFTPTATPTALPASTTSQSNAPANDIEDKTKGEKKDKVVADPSPRADLFECQKQADCQQDIVDGYRLPLHWGRLDPHELLPVLQNLNKDLVGGTAGIETDWRLRAHAAGRYVSLFAGMSLKKCWGLPITRRGSMRLNIAQGVLRRDVLLVAPRTDRRDRKRIHGRWWRTRLPHEVTASLQQIHTRHPSARSLGELLESEGLTYENCQQLLNIDWPTSHRPEDSRFALSLRPCLLHLGVHPALVARVTGDTMTTPASDHYYLSFLESQVHGAVWFFCRWAGLTAPETPARDRRIGTPKALSTREFRELMTKLNQLVLTARNRVTPRSTIAEIVYFHNLYTMAIARQIIWSVGGRGDLIFGLTFERIFANESFFAIGDRRVDRYSSQRICPSTKVVTQSRQHYLEHLRSLADSLTLAFERSAKFTLQLSQGFRPHAPAFHIYEATANGWTPRPLERGDLAAFALDLGVRDLNTARHYWFSMLVEKNVAQVAIEALLGHHITGAEPFGFGSGVSVREVCNYLRPILDDIQKDLGFTALQGRGRRAARFQTLPELVTEVKLKPLPNVLLQRKMDVQDFLVPEVAMYAQDAPSSAQTLVAHEHLARLKHAFLSSSASGKSPVGALLFCLIAEELVLTPVEQVALLHAALTIGVWTIGKLTVLEATDGTRPVAQRLASDHTLAAIHLARHRVDWDESTFAMAAKQLHQLLKTLDPQWQATSPNESLQLLSKTAGHWSAVEIAPRALFGVYHKAPFIPAEHLARLHFQRACAEKSAQPPTSSPRRSHNLNAGFASVIEILNHWGDCDLPLGEKAVARRNGCTAALAARRQHSSVDEPERLLIDLLIADLSANAPFHQLSPTVLPEYGRGYAIFFKYVRREGSVQLDPETLLEAYAEMGGDEDFTRSCPARWHMLHICAFLSTLGVWVPLGFLTTRGKKTPALPRSPVYTNRAEIGAARAMIDRGFAAHGGTYSFAGTRLALQREVPLRISEPRYSCLLDIDTRAGLFHVTTTGHAHLKSAHSRGSVPLSEPLRKELTELWQRRQRIAIGVKSLLFCDSHLESTYAAFDATTDAIRDAIAQITGCDEFRHHDLRAAAATDVAFDVEATLARLCTGGALADRQLSGDDLTKLHIRFAWSSRLARHASILTTLRYYICSGPLELRDQLDRAGQGQSIGGAYLAAHLGINAQALYARAHRTRRSGKLNAGNAESALQVTFQELLSDARKGLPTPALAPQDCASSPSGPLRPKAARLVEAGLLNLCGTAAEEAGDALLLPKATVEAVARLAQSQAQEMGVQLQWSDLRSPLLSSAHGGSRYFLAQLVGRYASWLCTSEPLLKRMTVSLLNCIDRSGSKLTMRTERQLLDLLPALTALRKTGFRVVLRFGASFDLNKFQTIEAALRTSALEREPVNSKKSTLATVAFLVDPDRRTVPSEKPASTNDTTLLAVPAKAAARSYGRAGRLVVAGLILGIRLGSLSTLEDKQ